MNKLRKQIALVFVALFATVCVFSSCSEEESMIDAEREHKVQELLSVSKALAKKHEIGLCFTERMIRGGIDTLTVEDLEQAYEVYAANTVEFYVCTDSVMANENGLKLSRSSRIMGEEVELRPEDGGSILGEFELRWTPNDRAPIDYSGVIRLRIDWGYYVMQGISYFLPHSSNLNSSVVFFPLDYVINFENLYGPEDDLNNDSIYVPNAGKVFETDGEFLLLMEEMQCDFVVWAKETVYTRMLKLTLRSHNAGLKGEFTLDNNGIII